MPAYPASLRFFKSDRLLEDSQLARKNAQLEEEKKKALESERTIAELRNSIRQEQARTEGMADSSAKLEAKTKNWPRWKRKSGICPASSAKSPTLPWRPGVPAENDAETLNKIVIPARERR